jgi:hypothetical protein
MIYDFRFMIYESPPDGRDLLDADGDEGYFAESGCVQDEDTARLQHLKIGHAELVVAVSVFVVVPDNGTSAGMDAFYGLAFQHRTIARRMKTMVVKDIEDEMRRLAASEALSIRAITEQIQPVSDRGCFNRRKGNLAVAGARERMNE